MTDAAAAGPATRSVRLTPGGQAVLLGGIAALAVWGDSVTVGLPAAAGCAAVLLSLIYAWRQSRGLVTGRTDPVTMTVGETAAVTLTLANRSALFAVRDVVLHQRAPAGYVPCLAAGEDGTVDIALRPRRRGRIRELKLAATTSFPFGLAEARVEFRAPADILVLPRPGSVRRLREVVALDGVADFRGTARRSGDGEFYGLKEWRDGESLSRVHWKISARRGRPILREFVHEHRPPVHLVLQLGVRRRGWKASFERAVSVTTTLAEHLLRHGHRVRLTLAGDEGLTLEQITGRSGLVAIQTALAEARAEPSDEPAAPDAGFEPSTRSRQAVIVVLAGGLKLSRDDSPREQRSWTVLDVDDPAVRAAFSRARPPSALPAGVPA